MRNSILVVAALMALVLVAMPASAATSELFLSEYIEGGSFNKAVEIYNGTGGPVDLAAGAYTLELYSNGSATVSRWVALSGTIADGDVFVLANGGAGLGILAQADLISSSVINFNGDDGVVLRKGGVIVDAFGQQGADPGSQWPGGGQNDTLRRKDTVCAGDTDFSNAFDASIEWDTFAQDTFDGLGSHSVNCATGPRDPVINEFVANHTGADSQAFVEVFGDGNTNYSALTVLEIEGEGSGRGVIDAVLPVGTTNGGGYWIDSEDMENATLTILLVENFTGSKGDDLDIDNDGTLDSTPWTRIVDDVAVSDGRDSEDKTYSSTVLAPFFDGNPFGAGGASRIPNGTDTDTAADWVRNDFNGFGFPGFPGSPAVGGAENTPDAVNVAITVATDPLGACGAPATLIHDIQGSGLSSSDVGSIREIEGVVVGDFQGSGSLNGFFVQEEDADTDADPSTSEGIFVFDSANAVALDPNDVVRVRGTVAEYSGLTEITNVAAVLDCNATGTATASTVSLPVTSVDDFEAFEGMRITFPQSLVISEYFNFDRFGEILLTSERHLQPTAEFEPGSAEVAQAMQNFLLDRITLDDGRGGSNPDPARHPNGLDFDLTNLFRGGDTVQDVTGVMSDAFGSYRIQPTQGANYAPDNPRTIEPDAVGGKLKVASFNVLNYFTTLDEGDARGTCGPSLSAGCRGADNTTEFNRQRDKMIAALTVIDADIVGLIEIENHIDDEAVKDLVSGLNAANGVGTYDYVSTGTIGTDAIKVALIYKRASVKLKRNFAILDSSVDPRFIDTKNRPALAQTFKDKSTGGVFTVAVNHFKSKGSSCAGNVMPDPDTGDGSANCNLTRTAAAEALVDWLAGDPTRSRNQNFLIIGDLNSYDKEDPIDSILAGGYTDLIHAFRGEDAYGYIFSGQTGYLDYALSSVNLTDNVTGATEWHINADEPDLIDYDTSFKKEAQDAIYASDPYRSSDHDPVIVGLHVCKEDDKDDADSDSDSDSDFDNVNENSCDDDDDDDEDEDEDEEEDDDSDSDSDSDSD